MTDNRATELLRKLLDERGVEWNKPKSAIESIQTTFSHNGWGIEVLERNIGLCVTATNLFDTPEQAIAATLGNGELPYDELIRCLENDWHIHASWDGLRRFWNIGLTEEGVKLRNELNARAERTCQPTNCDSGEIDVDVYAFSCGHVAYYPSVYENMPSYCPECGARVIE